MRKLLGSFVFLLMSTCTIAQDLSNKGKEFWLVFPAHVPSSQTARMGLFITSDKNSSGTISVNGWSTTFTVIANQVTGPIDVPYNVANIGNVNTVVNKGINVKVNAGQPAVVLYAHIYAGFRSEASLILPVQTLGRKYHSTNFWQASTLGSSSQFNVVATEANTVINYQLRINGVLQPTVTTVNLPNAGDQIQVQNANDLSGSVIESVASASGSCKKIAVFSGSSALRIGSSSCTTADSYDPLYQQCYPTNTWGKVFGIVPLLNNRNGYHLRVMAMEDNTTVNFDGTNITLNAGEYYPATSANPVAYIQAMEISGDKPISVSQYMMSRACTGAAPVGGAQQGDPDMIILNPVEQNISDISIFSSNLEAIVSKYLNVYIKTAAAASFRINGAAPQSTFTPMANGNGYSYLRENLTGYSGTFFRLTADSGFNAITYGMGDAESYGYSAGTNVKDLYQQIGLSSTYAIENTPTICAGTSFKFKVSLPYLADSIRWKLNGLPGNPADILMTYSNPPVAGDADSVRVLNGKNIYWYSLPASYSFTAVGTYPVALSVYAATLGGCGNEQQLDFELEVSAPPAPNFTSTFNGCNGETVQFNDITTTTKPTYRWWWSFNDPVSGANNTSTLQNPTHLFSGPGTYNVRFATITTAGCVSDTISNPVVVSQLPVGNITGDRTVCQNAAAPNVVFTATTGTAPFTFSYNINNGPPLTVQTTTGNSVTVPAPTGSIGTYAYHLVSIRDAGGVAGCTQPMPDTVTITVNGLPTATITGTTAVCRNAAAPFITFTGAGGGLTPYTFSYNINGGATQTISTVTGNSVTLPVPTGTAGPFVYNLLNVRDASPVVCAQPQAGSATVTVNALPTATIAGTTEVCINGTSPTVTFTGAGTVAPYTFTYTLNGGAPQTLVSTGNTASVTVPTNTAGNMVYVLTSVRDASGTNCSQAQTGTATVTVHPLPTAAFSFSTPNCVTRAITFTDNSVANVGTINSWAWNFGDPASGAANTSNLQNPTHIYSNPGTYTVTLTAGNSEGCFVTSLPTTITISTLPTANFTMPEVCLLDPVAQFTDISTAINPATITGWQWNFGDPASGVNNTSTAQNAQHAYTMVGVYSVRLIVTTNNGCTDTSDIQQLTVNGGNPVANFIQLNPTSSCSSDTVSIQNKSTIASGTITKVVIHWDNTNAPTVSETDEDPLFNKIYKHKYPTSSSTIVYNVRFRAYSGGVCVNDRILPVTVLATPDVSIAAIPDQCYSTAPLVLNFGSDAGANPGTATYSGPGISFNGTNWVFNAVSAGVGLHNIQYKFTATAGGCADSIPSTIRVLDTASARFALQGPACEKNSVRFLEQSTAPTGVVLASTVWDFGDGTPAATHPVAGSVTHTYATAGTYTVSMYNISAGTCRSATTSQQIVVGPKPAPNFTFPASLCLPAASVQFTNTSTIADGTESTLTYNWNFGNPTSASNTSIVKDPTHIYTAVGPFSVNLQVTSAAGCVHDTTIVLNTIHPQPKAGFSISRAAICLNDDVSFTDESTGADGSITSWTWNFGDGSIPSGITNPTYTYTAANNYTVSHFITNSFGCNSDTVRKPVKVYAPPTVNAGADIFVLEGGSSTLQPVYTGEDRIYLWSPADYLSSTLIANPVTKPLMDLTYRITVSNPGGCSAFDEVFVKVLKGPKIPNTFSPNGDGINDKWIIEYLDTYPNCKVVVFTRAGQKVFESRGYKVPWNGTINGKTLPLDTYYYIIEPENGRKPVTGYVTIVK